MILGSSRVFMISKKHKMILKLPYLCFLVSLLFFFKQPPNLKRGISGNSTGMLYYKEVNYKKHLLPKSKPKFTTYSRT